MKDEKRNQQGMTGEISRRTMLQSMAGLVVASALPLSLSGLQAQAKISNSINPRWYGFNLLEYFSTDPDWMKHFPYKNDGMFLEDDVKWMRDWGFNWVRLPMDYRFWTDPNDLHKINEKMVEPIDRAIKLGEKYGVHVNVSLHRAPGFCILDGADEKAQGIHITQEKMNLYRDQAALDAFVYQWVYFADRYKGISNEKVSFNLVNEPIERGGGKTNLDGEKQYIRVARAAVEGIRSKDPKRLIVTDGYEVGTTIIPGLYETGIVQSCHDYWPGPVTHYHAEWARPASMTWPLPTWPELDAQGKVIADKQIVVDRFRPWAEPAKHGIPIHFGEMGCNRYIPPKVVYAWFNDALDMIGGLNSGWALWNFRGPFGIMDTNREGTDYKDFHGHKLDHTLLKILQSKMKA
jgi:endoglucanase